MPDTAWGTFEKKVGKKLAGMEKNEYLCTRKVCIALASELSMHWKRAA
jgi:hypothetical protein